MTSIIPFIDELNMYMDDNYNLKDFDDENKSFNPMKIRLKKCTFDHILQI